MHYIDTETIKSAYNDLSNIDVKNASIFHIFLILKGCGINDTSFQSIESISERGLPFASDLSLLFSYYERKPNKFEFINPFSMKTWGGQAPSESLRKWVSSRIKNNIIGGATTWRKIIREDIYSNKIKFANNYIAEIKNLTIPDSKIKLWPLVIWYNRFNKFEQKFSPRELIEGFINDFNISERELGVLFDRSISIQISYAFDQVDMEIIRKLIGSPPNISITNWEKSITLSSAQSQEYYNFKNTIMSSKSNISVAKIQKLLKDNYQIILSGPPGTSKSYIANIIANNISKGNNQRVLKIQFHPQYTYQDFIGGFIVNGEKVEANDGVYLRFLKDALSNKTDEFVIIIDEFNRANVGSVFGELIQCLDRNYCISTLIAGKIRELQIPKNVFIIATMNTSDRTLGSIDFALRRRFTDIYIGPNESELIDRTNALCGISLSDFLKKINTQLQNSLKNNEFVIGQTIFYRESLLDEGKYIWNNSDLEDLFNYKILTMVEDYCSKERNKITEIVGTDLASRLTGEPFITALSEFVK